ncbi:calcium-binding protein [Chamaesiphon sp. GL140_3_metabinner_50]|uniref:calcium-binding protein n=1 Tax=Chamaesiphon sp. GL140_3_metabinner_50 TaxID=2970812 RepID=UPI0025DF5915|nr:calcium-binding protein [Chamaesiphon sp. GL140_3_metabinner_50]
MVARNFRGITYSVITATANSQTINGTTKPDWIEVLGGNNIVTTGNGNDVVLAGVNFLFTRTDPPFGGEAISWGSRTDAGNNTIITGDGNDYVAAGLGGNDVVDLGTGDDIFDGAVVDISGKTGNDIINAGAGNDIIYAWGAGNKTINGGTGNDTISVRGFGNTIINGGEGNDRIEIIDGAQLSNVKGGVDRHFISAGVGDDIIIVSSEDDIFTVDAGSGNDFMDIGSSNGTFDAGDGNDDIFALLANQNKISAGAGNDLIVLDASASTGNVVFGGTGDDTIVTIPIFGFDPDGPALGQHEIHGGAGNDTIFSGIGNDTIYDDAGDDIINLRGGFVNLRGQLITSDYSGDFGGSTKLEVIGGGIDTLYLGAGKDTVMLGKEGKATIYGFTAIDKLDLGGLGVTLSRNLQGDTLVTTNDSQQLQLATLVGYGGQVSII